MLLLSTIGSRGDVQPLVALGLALRDLRIEARFCVPPDFQPWIEGLGFAVTPIGPSLRSTAAPSAGRPSPSDLAELARRSVVEQFATVHAAAEGCDGIVGATALQIAAPSVAQVLGVPYRFLAYCPIVLPSPRHSPSLSVPRPTESMFGAPLNAHRAALGLDPVADTQAHVLTGEPWLACDPVLGPWPGPGDVWQPGALLVADDRPLDDSVEQFLAAGSAPVYFGLGSIRSPTADLGATMLAAARAAGRRAIVSAGWAGLDAGGDGPDCLTIGEVNQQALFARVAAVVHHGGAGTTTAAAAAGVPQVVLPQVYDQPYWAARVAALGVGVAATPDSLGDALHHVLGHGHADRARALAPQIRTDGANLAAQRLHELLR
ncbi:glycosyltransferase [Dactylosporangium vinaceum]|uniref:Glycosyltransferase n=1 Tax=Dactylosporangium vinaceum TaxID=53362 RepID=A0ABV5MKJ7_9ACTN|nr:glycosyltransferase [Dactylosporangium vinaceum]